MVIFRGTDATADGDWATNANAIKVSYGPDGKKLEATVVAPDFWNKNVTYSLQVHGGFNGVFSDNLYEEVLSVLNSDEILDRRVDIDGVSHLRRGVTAKFTIKTKPYNTYGTQDIYITVEKCIHQPLQI